MARERELVKALKAFNVYQEIFVPIEGCGPRIAARLLSAIIDIRRFWVEPDGVQIGASYEKSKKLEGEVAPERYFDRVADRMKPGMRRYEKLQLVKGWLGKNGQAKEAALLEAAIAEHKLRAGLRHKAKSHSAAKLKAFCGVHVLPDGTFPRRRSGQVANWHPDARQALYLIGDQFNRRPNSPWGKKLRENKVKLRERHPHVECSTCAVSWEQCKEPKAHKRRYSDGHIHKMAIWRTLTQFVETLFHDWSRLEEQHRAKAKPNADAPEPTAPVSANA